MKIHISNGQVSFEGKTSEEAKIQSAINEMMKVTDYEIEYQTKDFNDDYAEMGFGYDMDSHTVAEVKEIWKKVKKGL